MTVVLVVSLSDLGIVGSCDSRLPFAPTFQDPEDLCSVRQC